MKDMSGRVIIEYFNIDTLRDQTEDHHHQGDILTYTTRRVSTRLFN